MAYSLESQSTLFQVKSATKHKSVTTSCSLIRLTQVSLQSYFTFLCVRHLHTGLLTVVINITMSESRARAGRKKEKDNNRGHVQYKEV